MLDISTITYYLFVIVCLCAYESAKEQISSKTANQVFACLVCGGCQDEDWIQCHKCQEWAHEKCADLTDARFYYCDNCA